MAVDYYLGWYTIDWIGNISGILLMIGLAVSIVMHVVQRLNGIADDED
jgi:hypothetical protein